MDSWQRSDASRRPSPCDSAQLGFHRSYTRTTWELPAANG
jgi:hypothetical protein